MPNFPKKQIFLTPWYVCASGGKKCWFFGKFGVLFFLKPALRFALLPYYRQINILFRDNCMNFNIFLLKIEKLSEFLTFLSRFFHSVTMNGKSEFLIKCMPNTELRWLLIFLVLYVLSMVGILLNRNLGDLAFL